MKNKAKVKLLNTMFQVKRLPDNYRVTLCDL